MCLPYKGVYPMSEAELARIEEWSDGVAGRGAADLRAVCQEVRRCWAEMKRREEQAKPPALPPAEKSS